MNQRSHVLYEQLKGFVQRMDMSVVKKDLPPKTVFVIAVKLSHLQRQLYKRFLDVHGFTKDKVSGEKIIKRSFFAGYQALAQVYSLFMRDFWTFVSFSWLSNTYFHVLYMIFVRKKPGLTIYQSCSFMHFILILPIKKSNFLFKLLITAPCYNLKTSERIKVIGVIH